ncbi:MAG: hemerythrin domain-containing protein [Candidatus Tumulicola sp.]
MNPAAGELASATGDAFATLRSDHEVVKNLLAELVQPDDRTLRRTMLNRLKTALAIHNATEESLIYPATRVLAGRKDRAERLYRETAEADVLLFEIDLLREDDDVPDFDEKVAKLRDAIVAHIDEEETTIFPDLLDRLGADGCKRLAQSMREFRGAFEPHPSQSKIREVEGLG